MALMLALAEQRGRDEAMRGVRAEVRDAIIVDLQLDAYEKTCPTCRGAGGGQFNDCPTCGGNGVV